MKEYDVIIAGSGIAGLFAALNLGEDKSILVITKNALDESDSFLAQGGICVQRDDDDYESLVEDTLRAGHYENNIEAVDIMVRSSREIINDLIDIGVNFDKKGDEYSYTKEGAHSKARILHFKDSTGEEINSKLIRKARERKNITIIEKSRVIDILQEDNICCGVVARNEENKTDSYYSNVTILATGGIGGLFTRSTNFSHLTGDAIAIALRHGIKVKNLNYIQFHPTSLYTEKPGRAFLISESVRGEGAILVNKNGERFVDELLPRDVVTKKIYEQMEKDETPYVRLCLYDHVKTDIKQRFPAIYGRCRKEGYDITKQCVPVVPAQHYFMGGIEVNMNSKTSMDDLYAVGETSCNGVHGKNRLASNSLLESLVFAKRAALDIEKNWKEKTFSIFPNYTYPSNEKIGETDRDMILKEIKRQEDDAL
jgi:L-aspartate oxidase